MIESSIAGKKDRLAAFLSVFRLGARVVRCLGEETGPCLLLCGTGAAEVERIVLRMQGPGEPPAGLLVTVAIDFDNTANPLMAALPGEVSVPLEQAHALKLTAQAFFLEVQGDRCGRGAAVDRLAEVMVLMVLRQVIDQGVQLPGMFAALAHPALHRALVSMHDEPERAWSVEQLAESAAMSRTQFMTTFRRVVGMTPMAYLGAWRLTLARRHLQAGLPVKAVARRVGFSSAEGFSRAFSRAYGHPPMEVVHRVA